MVNQWGPTAFGAARGAVTRPAFTPSNAAGDQDDWYQDCTSPAARDGTEFKSSWLNGILANLRAIVSKSNQVKTNLDDALLARALRSQRLNYAGTVGGTANALTFTLDPAPTSYAELLMTPIRLIPIANNTGATTVTPSGLATKSLVKDGSLALAANDLIAGRPIEIIDDGTNYHLLSTPVLPFTRRQVFLASGTFTPPAGVTRARVRVWGAGGGSGGTFGTGAGSSGGGGGGYAEGIVAVTPGTGVTVTVGAAGAAGTSAAANLPAGTGGTSSFGALVSATGGIGGNGAVGVVNASSVSAGGTGTGGDLQITGNTSDAPFPISGSNVVVGAGGGSFGGTRAHQGLSGGTSTGGVTGIFPGGGATGSANQADGAPGAPGLVIVEY